MTPQEKAKEIFFKMFRSAVINSFEAKRCALVHVDEMISFLNGCPIFNKGKDTDKIWGYWQEVKEEIEKL